MSQIQKQIALLHHTGGGNLGDEASLDAVILNIRRRWPQSAITIFSMNPDDTAKKHGVPSYPIRRYSWGIGYQSDSKGATQTAESSRGHYFQALTSSGWVRPLRFLFHEPAFLLASRRILASFDYLIVTGGGQFTERGGPWSLPYALWIWLLMAKSVHVKCVLLNVGAGPLNHPLSKAFAKRALLAADYVSFRDTQSEALARRVGYSGKSQIFPDNVYSLNMALPEPSLERPHAPVVGIAPMPYPFCDPREHPDSNLQSIYHDYLAKIAACCSSLARDSYTIELFGSDFGVDPLAIEDLRTALQDRYHIATPPYRRIDSVHDVLARMSAMDYVVTCRFHGVVFAHLLNKPVLAISHHPKVANLMHDLGLSQYCVDIQTFSPQQLTQKFQSLVRNTKEVKSIMAASVAQYKSQLAVQFDQLFPADPGQTPTSDSNRPECREGIVEAGTHVGILPDHPCVSAADRK
jgi:polysaccharide pyruvyl transferase WcaK-like protein